MAVTGHRWATTASIATSPDDLELAGGNALNVAAGLAAAGLDSHYMGAIGEDADGRADPGRAPAVRESAPLASSRLDEPTGVTLVRLRRRRRAEFVEERYGASSDYAPVDADVEFLRGCGWVHCVNLPEPAALMERLDGVRASYRLRGRRRGRAARSHRADCSRSPSSPARSSATRARRRWPSAPWRRALRWRS